MKDLRRLAGAALLAVAVCPPPLAAQARAGRDTVVATAGARYRAGPLHRFVLGRHYRDLWTTPMRVEVLDLRRYAGGLQPLRTGGGRQTRSLRFLGADGREYSFRSVDKDPSPVLDSLLRETVVDDLVQDGISAAHPLGALVAAPLLDAAGVMHVSPQLRVMPDDPALGGFREEFAGMLGLIEERPDENERGPTAFQDAVRVIGSEALTERLDEGPADLVDARAFLTARIVDLLMGDWDRHRGQWRWATYDEGERRTWLPIPVDRDQAFSKFDGVAPRIVSLYMPQFVRFETDYPDIERLHWNARALDRWFLSGLERAVWDSIGAAVRARIDDAVITDAVRRLPPEIFEKNGEELTRVLRARRDGLPRAWDALYRVLAESVDVHGSGADEELLIDATSPDRVLVQLTAPAVSAAPYLTRAFDPAETREIRIYLGGGDDRVVVRGVDRLGVRVRVVGGQGDDRYTFEGAPGWVSLYDAEGDNAVEGAGAPLLDAAHFEEWVWTEEDRDQPRDWGARLWPIFWTSYSSDLGLFLGGGTRVETYGFRKRPYASGFDLRGGFSPQESKGRLQIDGTFHGEGSAVFARLRTRLSGLDVIHYYGLGNDAPSEGVAYHRVDQRSLSLAAEAGVQAGDALTLRAGFAFERVTTPENADRYFGTLRDTVYGAIGHSQLSAVGVVEYDPQRGRDLVAHRLRLRVAGEIFPALFDVDRVFGKASAELSALLSRSPLSGVSLALRAGAEQIWGRFPWSEAAFLGGVSTLRGWTEQRFAGDASAHASAELRVRLWHPRVVVPVATGVFGFAEAGRVGLDGASPGGWHTGVGGGLWFKPLGQAYLLRAGVGVGEEATRLYVDLGLPY